MYRLGYVTQLPFLLGFHKIKTYPLASGDIGNPSGRSRNKYL